MGAKPNRDGWATGGGFFLVSSGAALGSGFFWSVAAHANRSDQLDFWLLYLLALLLVGAPLLATEWILGKLGQQNPVGAFRELERSSLLWQALGLLLTLAAVLVFIQVVGLAGKQLAFLTRAVLGVIAYAQPPAEIAMLYAELLQTPAEQIFWQGIFIFGLLPLAVVAMSAGSERLSYLLWPLAIVSLTILAGHAWLGTEAAVAVKVPAAAPLGFADCAEAITLALLTVTVGWGMQLTLGSYLPIHDDLTPWLALQGGLLLLVSLFASLAVMPSQLGIATTAADASDLLFRVLPLVWAQTPGGQLLAMLFYLALLLLAVVTASALFEVLGAFFNEEFGWERGPAMLVTAAAVFAFSLPVALWPTLGNVLVRLLTDGLLPALALLLSFYAGWVLDQARAQNGLGSGSAAVFLGWRLCIQFLTPLLLLVTLAQHWGLI